jgi:thiol-disulfide isomerase/thioredoxin
MRFIRYFGSLVSVIFGVTLAGGIASSKQAAFLQGSGGLNDYGPAPEIESLAWLNSDQPLPLASLRGQVVLVEFWTFDCINCIRTLPYVENWYQTYRDQGLAVIGVHFPEFDYERDVQNILAATRRLNVSYPVALDNSGMTWQAWGQRYWPTIYLIDKQGNIRYVRIGEGSYDQTEQAIRDLLAETVEETTPQAPPTYLTPVSLLNVRSAPGIENAIVGAIEPGMAFVILDEQDGWYQISYNDGMGFVSGAYVTVVEESEPIN